MDFFSQGIPLGRWFRIRVIIQWTFVLYAGFLLYESRGPAFGWNALYLFLLFGTVLVHEFGHALSCRAMGGQADHIILWPLGGIAFVQPPMNPWAWLVTTACGPLVNAVLWPVFWLVTQYWVLPQNVLLGDQGEVARVVGVACVDLLDINRLLLLFNLIPAYPMDGGRLLQEILWFVIGYRNSLRVAGMVGVVAGIAFVCIGIGLAPVRIPIVDFELGQNPMLMVIGVMCTMASMGIYRQAQLIESWRKR